MPGTELVNRATGERELIDDADLQSALASKKYLAPEAVAAHTSGEDVYVRPEQLKSDSATTTAISPGQAAAAAGAEARRQRNTGYTGMAKAAAGSFLGGSTFGVINPWEEAQEAQPLAASVGTAASYIAPFLIPGGEAELALREPAAAEHIAGSLSSKFMHAGEIGAKEGTAGRAMEASLLRGKAGRLAGEIGEEGAERAAASVFKPEEAEQIAKMSRPELSAARKSELANIQAERAPQMEHVIRDIGQHQDVYMGEDELFLAMQDTGIRDVTNASKAAVNAGKKLVKLGDNPQAYVRNPGQVLDALTAQQTALEKVAANEPKLRELFAADESGAREAALDRLPDVLERNRALQERVKAVLAPPASERLSAIENAESALNGPAKKEGMVSQLLGGHVFHAVASAASAVPVLGPMLGAKAAELAKSLIFGHGAGAIGESAGHAAAVAKKFVGRSLRGPGPPTAATRVLADAAFGPRDPSQSAPKTLAGHYNRISAELRAATAYDAMGVPRMKPDARQEMASKLDAFRMIGTAGPILADKIETTKVREVEFLSSKLPRRPDLPGMQHWQPTDMQMRTFARYVDAAEHPEHVEERIHNGTCSPEDAEAYRFVYPERHAALVAQIVQAVAETGAKIPFKRQMSLSIFSGTATHPALDPAVIATLQTHFAKEMGSQGGTGNPVPNAAFGSVKKSAPEPTPGDKRAQGG